MKLLLRGGRLVDPVNDRDGICDVLIEDGVVARVDRDLAAAADVAVLDVPKDAIVCPGLIDMHVHLREPGQEHKEDVASGVRSAVAGGFTAVACMPNTSPVNDNASVTELILERAAHASLARVYPIGAVSVGQNGERLAELAELRDAGCVAVSDDGRPVATALLMRRALEYADMLGLLVIDHCEDQTLKGEGVAHEGYHASVLGLRGIPGEAEELMVERDITLAGLTRARVHIAHLSTRGSLRAVRDGKARGIGVTCEVTPHHLTLTDEALGGYDTNTKMNPPLREEADRDALIEGLRDGTVDVIATDHAPHHADEKAVEFDRAPFGIVGLETCVPLILDRVVHAGAISMRRFVELLSVNPARLLRVSGGSLRAGQPADITVLLPDLEVSIDKKTLRSKSKNTPFDGWRLRGGVGATFVGGRLVYRNGDASSLAAWGELSVGSAERVSRPRVP